jgi:TonB family protein
MVVYHMVGVLITLASAGLSTQSAQEPAVPATNEESELIERLKSTNETQLRYQNAEETPVKITGAAIRSVRLEKTAGSSSKLRGDYVLTERVALTNLTDRRITRVTLEYANFSERKENFHTSSINIPPRGSSVFPEQNPPKPELTATFTDPRELTVRVTEVRFEDASIWEVDANLPEQSEIDTKPILLNKPKPDYSEHARKNRISGSVRLALLIAEDGSVARARIRKGLPDGLNEEAVVAASGLKFKPAMKGGQPVEHWILFEIDFSLPAKRN